MVSTCREKIFVDYLLTRKSVLSKVPIRKDRAVRVGHMPERKVRGRVRIHGDIPRRKNARPRTAQHGNRSNALRLPDAFKICKEESAVFHQRTTDRSAKLVPLEGRNVAYIEVVLGVEFAVPQKLIGTAMNLIRPGPRDRVDHATRCLAIVRLVVAGQDGKFLDRVDPKVSSQYAAGRAVGIVIEADPVQTIVVLLRPRTGNGQLLSKPAISSIRACRKIGLSVDCVNSS